MSCGFDNFAVEFQLFQFQDQSVSHKKCWAFGMRGWSQTEEMNESGQSGEAFTLVCC